jgi:hypothetical protein
VSPAEPCDGGACWPAGDQGEGSCFEGAAPDPDGRPGEGGVAPLGPDPGAGAVVGRDAGGLDGPAEGAGDGEAAGAGRPPGCRVASGPNSDAPSGG